MSKIVAFLKNESGATAIEYGLLAALIAVVIIGAVMSLGTTLQGVFSGIDSDQTLGTTLHDKFNSINNSLSGTGG
jgi:pilus assembly protein Flp/PilA